jgi:hypothetical protein
LLFPLAQKLIVEMYGKDRVDAFSTAFGILNWAKMLDNAFVAKLG